MLASVLAPILLSGLMVAPAYAAAGQPFTQIESPFTEALYGHAPPFFGGIAFAPNGDVWVDECQFSGSPLIRFARSSTTFEHGTVVHTQTTVPSNAGCGLTNHPDGHLYSNTAAGLSRLDPSTGTPIDTVGTPGNALGVTVDPQSLAVVYVASDCRFSSTCTIKSFNPANGALTQFAQLSSSDASFVDGITFDSTGNFLFMSNRSPSFRLTILGRSGHIVQSIPMAAEPDGISFHGASPQFVVTNNTDGTMTRFDFPANDFTQTPSLSTFASGGHRGDLSLVGTDGCIYLSQLGTNFLDGSSSSDNSVVQICPGFTPSPGVGSRLRYVALGDSYSSGEGAPPFEDGTNYPPAVEQENTYTYAVNGVNGNGCHRSLTDYAKLSGPILQPGSTTLLVDRTCSGAQIVPPAGSDQGPIVPTQATSGRTDDQVNQALNRLNRDFGGLMASDVNVVSVTMGGNDSGFGDLIQACLIPNIMHQLFNTYPSTPGEVEWIATHFGSCQFFDDQFFHTADKINALGSLELQAQASATNTFSNARVLQLTYPDFVPLQSDFAGDSCGGVLRQDSNYTRSKAQQIDAAIRAAGATTTSQVSSRFQIVDLENSFGLNGLCPADPSKALVNGIDPAALANVINGLVAPGTQTRGLLDALTSAYVNLRNCILSIPLAGPGAPIVALFCKSDYDALNAALAALKAYFTPAKITALVGDLAFGSTQAIRFDNSRLFFHPNAVGWGVMSCNFTAAFQGTSQSNCQPSLGGVLTYLLNGISLSTSKPVVLTPGAPTPFQFNGFDPRSTVSITGFSSTLNLGAVAVDGSGIAQGSFTLPANLNPGVHKVVFQGTNHGTPRTIEVLVQINGRPRGGEDFGLYFGGFNQDSAVDITYGGVDWGIQVPDDSGGVFVEVPVPVPSQPSSIDVVATGLMSHKVVKQTIVPAPRDAAAWAGGGPSASLSVSGSGITITGWAHSDGSVVVKGHGLTLTGGVEYVTSATMTGSGNTVSPAPVQVAAGGEPLTVNIVDWRPGGAKAVQLGSLYQAVSSSACSAGVWHPNPGDIQGSVVYVPCSVEMTLNGPIGSSIIAEGSITMNGNGTHLTGAATNFSLASAATAANTIVINGSGFSADRPVWAAGGISLAGDGEKLSCGVYGASISVTAGGTELDACDPGP